MPVSTGWPSRRCERLLSFHAPSQSGAMWSDGAADEMRRPAPAPPTPPTRASLTEPTISIRPPIIDGARLERASKTDTSREETTEASISCDHRYGYFMFCLPIFSYWSSATAGLTRETRVPVGRSSVKPLPLDTGRHSGPHRHLPRAPIPRAETPADRSVTAAGRPGSLLRDCPIQ